MVYTQEEIRQAVLPVAEKYQLQAVYLFGSYARGTATEQSDIDLLIDTAGTQIKSLLQLAAVYCDLEVALGKKVDVVTLSALEQKAQMPSEESFRNHIWNEKVNLYAVA